MKFLVVGKEYNSTNFNSIFKSRFVEAIVYNNPLKAMDNLKEISPDIVYFIHKDYPRHWKIILAAAKEFNITFILEGILDENALKDFNFLKGDKVCLDSNEALDYLTQIIPRVHGMDLFYPENTQMGLGFINPGNFSFINGYITLITPNKIYFKTEQDPVELDIELNSTIKDASLSFKETVVTLDLKIQEISDSIVFSIENRNNLLDELLKSLFV